MGSGRLLARRRLPDSSYLSFSYLLFEAAFFGMVKELKPSDILPRKASDVEKTIADMTGEVEGVKARLSRLEAKLVDEDLRAFGRNDRNAQIFGLLVHYFRTL